MNATTNGHEPIDEPLWSSATVEAIATAKQVYLVPSDDDATVLYDVRDIPALGVPLRRLPQLTLETIAGADRIYTFLSKSAPDLLYKIELGLHLKRLGWLGHLHVAPIDPEVSIQGLWTMTRNMRQEAIEKNARRVRDGLTPFEVHERHFEDTITTLLAHAEVLSIARLVPRRRGEASESPNGEPITGLKVRDLMREEFPPLEHIIPNLIMEGLNLLCGGPKLGKSLLMLNCAVAVAQDGVALGTIQVEKPGAVLYLSLEDHKRRLQRRFVKLLKNVEASEHLEYQTRWKRLNEGGLEDLERWIASHPQRRLIVIDTLQRIRPKRRRGGNAYDEDYEALQPLQDLVNKHPGLAIVVLHHTNKQGDSEDFFYQFNGSQGLGGGVDGGLLLKRRRGQADAILQQSHRDLDEDLEVALRLDPETGWTIIGKADEYQLSRERTQILRAIRQSPRALKVTEIMQTLGIEPTKTERNRLYNRLFQLVGMGLLYQPTYGSYDLPERREKPQHLI